MNDGVSGSGVDLLDVIRPLKVWRSGTTHSYEFYRMMAPTIAAIKCGHTGVGMSPDVRAETEGLPWLPFDVKVLESKAHIFRDYAKSGILAGKEIQSINGVHAARIMSTMLAASMKDGDVQSLVNPL